jgi:hypothetical protein
MHGHRPERGVHVHRGSNLHFGEQRLLGNDADDLLPRHAKLLLCSELRVVRDQRAMLDERLRLQKRIHVVQRCLCRHDERRQQLRLLRSRLPDGRIAELDGLR